MKRLLTNTLRVVIALISWAVVVFLGTINGLFHQPITKQNNTDSFRKATQLEIDKQFVGNFAMAIIKNGLVDYEQFHSVGNTVDRNTVFQVASLSKWVSAFGIMKLVENGQLDLDAPVGKYLTRWQLPPSPFNNEEVTVRRLLSHTAGLTDGLGYSGFEEGKPPQSIEQSLTKAADADEGKSGVVSVGRKPGSEFNYSGGGYTLLQLVVEEVSGQSFATYMKSSVFEPLKMTHSTYVWDKYSPDVLADFYASDGTPAKHYHYTSLAATSLYTSVSDLELFFEAHLEGESLGRNILKPETVRLMRKPHGRKIGVAIWGLGTVLYAPIADDDYIIGHDGKSTPAINTAVRLNPKTGDGIIVFETGSPGIATRLASEWVFWKTGQVDTFLLPMLINKLVLLVGIGWLVIILVTILYTTMPWPRIRWRKFSSSDDS